MAGQNKQKRQNTPNESFERATKRKKIIRERNEETEITDNVSDKNNADVASNFYVIEILVETATGSLSLSVDDTKSAYTCLIFSKLRAQIGLAPLETDEDAKNEVLAEKYREKIQLLKEKREMHLRISKIKKIYEIDESDEIDDVTSWVTKTRSLPASNHPKHVPKIITKEQPSLFVEHDQGEFEA
ncbi:hypothetical protein MXB_629 [Myxobolus squamalis]|nr:hypothetical protein MXB_629 [Myxobolus squamalis]